MFRTGTPGFDAVPGAVPWESVSDTPPSLFRAASTLVMGIVNVTPDSFSDGGRYLNPEKAVAHARMLLAEGADILDIGGESTRPGSEGVSVSEELERVRPVIEALLTEGHGVPLSIDTMKPEVADACLAMGVRIVNDVTGLRNPEMRQVAAKRDAAVVIMHMKGMPRTMQVNPEYGDVVAEVREELATRLHEAREAGIADMAIDPGIGFGKTAAHNFTLLRRLEEFLPLGAPVLVGPSRKSFIGTLPGAENPDQRLEGTIAACVVSAMKGASVVRVHDVAACKRALRLVDAVRSAQE